MFIQLKLQTKRSLGGGEVRGARGAPECGGEDREVREEGRLGGRGGWGGVEGSTGKENNKQGF